MGQSENQYHLFISVLSLYLESEKIFWKSQKKFFFCPLCAIFRRFFGLPGAPKALNIGGLNQTDNLRGCLLLSDNQKVTFGASKRVQSGVFFIVKTGIFETPFFLDLICTVPARPPHVKLSTINRNVFQYVQLNPWVNLTLKQMF